MQPIHATYVHIFVCHYIGSALLTQSNSLDFLTLIEKAVCGTCSTPLRNVVCGIINNVFKMFSRRILSSVKQRHKTYTSLGDLRKNYPASSRFWSFRDHPKDILWKEVKKHFQCIVQVEPSITLDMTLAASDISFKWFALHFIVYATYATTTRSGSKKTNTCNYELKSPIFQTGVLIYR
jgi:hypothetical protein